MSAKARLTASAILLLDNTPDGLRHSELIKALKQRHPEINAHTIVGTVVGLVANNPDKVCKPTRGLFKSSKHREPDSQKSASAIEVPLAGQPKEEDFYSGFAAYLTDDLEECTKAVPLGGALFKDKWGTPDVIGIRRARESDIIKFPTEIVTRKSRPMGTT